LLLGKDLVDVYHKNEKNGLFLNRTDYIFIYTALGNDWACVYNIRTQNTKNNCMRLLYIQKP